MEDHFPKFYSLTLPNVCAFAKLLYGKTLCYFTMNLTHILCSNFAFVGSRVAVE